MADIVVAVINAANGSRPASSSIVVIVAIDEAILVRQRKILAIELAYAIWPIISSRRSIVVRVIAVVDRRRPAT